MVKIIDTEKLSPPYDAFLRNKAWDSYIKTLSREGMFWWFNLDVQALSAHLTPLLNALDGRELPARLCFLSQVVNQTLDPDELARWRDDFLERGDVESAAATATAAIMILWESGRDFQQLDHWRDNIDALTSGQSLVPAVAKASLMGAKCLIEFAVTGDLRQATKSGGQAILWSQRAGSNSLRVYNAMMRAYAGLWNADPHGLESIISDARVLSRLSEVSFAPRAVFQFIHGFYLLLTGNAASSRREMKAVSPDGLPDDLWRMGHFNALQTAAALNDTAWINRTAKDLRRQDVDESRPYQEFMRHFILGVARFAQGRTDEARRLAWKALDLGRRSGAPGPEHHIRLLLAQIHSETNDNDAALDLLETWKGIWRDRGYHLYMITAHLEIARIQMRQGDKDGARREYNRAVQYWSFGKTPHAMNRSRDFVQKIQSALDREPAVQAACSLASPPAVSITTFGGLCIYMGVVAIDGNQWRGSKTKDMLKALIVFGGSNISSDRIMDALWPEADGAQGARNLKVTLSRLRRVGCKKGEQPLPWILARHKRLSLDQDLCQVDVFQFRERLGCGMKIDMDVESLREAIDLYKGDFLPEDRNADWVADHRRKLRSEYVDGVALMVERLLGMGRPDEAAAALESALEKVGLDSDLYALLMRAYIDLDQPGKVRDTFYAAAEQLKAEFGIDPDPKLVRIARVAGIL